MNKPLTPVIAVSAAVWNAAGEILVIQRDKAPGAGLWSLPGGKLEAMELLALGVMREVQEETGLDIEVGPLVEISERISASEPAYHYVIVNYVARIAQSASNQVAVASSDARQARFLSIVELQVMATAQLTEGLLMIVQKARTLAIKLGWISP